MLADNVDVGVETIARPTTVLIGPGQHVRPIADDDGDRRLPDQPARGASRFGRPEGFRPIRVFRLQGCASVQNQPKRPVI